MRGDGASARRTAVGRDAYELALRYVTLGLGDDESAVEEFVRQHAGPRLTVGLEGVCALLLTVLAGEWDVEPQDALQEIALLVAETG
jgi:hypothetical protein